MAARNVAALSQRDKLKEALERGLKRVPGDAGAQLKALLTPSMLATLLGSLVGLAVAQAFGVGEFIDGLMLIAGIGFCGWGAVEGARDLFQFMKTAMDARSDHDLDVAAQYFADGVVKLGVNAVMAFFLKKPFKSFRELKGFRFRNVEPGWLDAGAPPAPGSIPAIQYKPLPPASLGETTAYGTIVIDNSLSAEEAQITLDHELVHRFFSPKFGPFLRMRASIRISGYVRPGMLRWLEEAIAEGYAQVRAHGWQDGVITGIHWPVVGGYLSIEQVAVIRGSMIGTVVVAGHLYHVSLVRGQSPHAIKLGQPQPAAAPALAPAH